jgi:hypothetical protein
MPGKMARSAPSTTVRAARRASSRPHLVLREGRKSANIYASLGFIRGIPVKTSSAGLNQGLQGNGARLGEFISWLFDYLGAQCS